MARIPPRNGRGHAMSSRAKQPAGRDAEGDAGGEPGDDVRRVMDAHVGARETATVPAIVHHSVASGGPSQPLSTVAAKAAELA